MGRRRSAARGASPRQPRAGSRRSRKRGTCRDSPRRNRSRSAWFESTSRFGLAQSPSALGKGYLQAFAGDEGWLLVVPDGLGDLVVERLELAIRAHRIVVEHPQLADAGGAGEGG